MDLLFSFSGRIGRAKWWLTQLAIVIVWALAFGVFGLFVRVVDPSSAHAPGELSNGGLSLGIALLCAILLSVWINLAGTAKRLHDRDKSIVWFALMFVPLIGPVWLIVECGLLEGTRGGNRFGPSPGGDDGFSSELDAHIAQMQAQRMPLQQAPTVARAAVSAPAPQTSGRRSTTPGGFGRRGL